MTMIIMAATTDDVMLNGYGHCDGHRPLIQHFNHDRLSLSIVLPWFLSGGREREREEFFYFIFDGGGSGMKTS